MALLRKGERTMVLKQTFRDGFQDSPDRSDATESVPRRAQGDPVRWEVGDLSPWDIQTVVSCGKPFVKTSAVAATLSFAEPNSRAFPGLTLPPSSSAPKLHSVTDAQNRDASREERLEQLGVGLGRARVVNGRRPAGEDHAFRLERQQVGNRMSCRTSSE